MPDTEDVVERCQQDDLDFVRLRHVDNGGVVRGRTVDADDIESVLESGHNMAKIIQAFTALDVPAASGPFGAAGEARLIPDPDTFRTVPYADRTAAMMVDKYTVDGDRWGADGRTVLGDFLDSFPYDPSVSFESEFYLTRETEDGDLTPFDDALVFTDDGMQNAHDVVTDMIDALTAQGMSLSSYYAEYGPGQQELIMEHSAGLQAPDEQVLYKQTVKAVARQHGLRATFSPKPFSELPGSGCHIHLSLWDGDENAFYDSAADSAYGITETCRQFIGGILEHAPALLALTAPSVVSYKRLQPHMWSSAYTAWGLDNREGMVRVPSSQWDDPESTTRIEIKPADNTANPYLALLGLLAAGQDGIERELDPGDPLNQDPGALPAAERADRDIERFPETLGEALDALEEDAVLAEAMGETLHEAYMAVKRNEWNEASSTATEWESENLNTQF